MKQHGKWMVASKLEKRALLIAINGLAGMSIFFFGKWKPDCTTPILV
jgi:hypothetical protein